MMLRLRLLLLLITLSACGTSTGSDFDDAKLGGLVKGRTTYAEVLKLIGEPETYSRQADGTTVVAYSHMRLSQSPLGMIPIVGAFTPNSGYRMSTKNATLSFDADGVLQDWTYNQTGSGAPFLPAVRVSPPPPPSGATAYAVPPDDALTGFERAEEADDDSGPILSPDPVVRPQLRLSGRRIALVIGNAAYRSIDPLRNPANDAQLVARRLQRLGYVLVGGGAQLDLDRMRFENAIQDFGRAIPGADIALFYYAGHGLQVDGTNWLVPVDAEITPRKQDLPFRMMAADDVLLQMDEAGTQLNLVVLDACRNNPLVNRGLRSAARGLAEMHAPSGSMIAYATQPGSVAFDGDGPNSPYSAALADAMLEVNPDIFHLFNSVGLRVQEETEGQQVPWTSNSPIRSDVRFSGI